MLKKQARDVARKRRHLRVRKKIFGTSDVPRFTVHKSLKNIYAQLIDDEEGITLAAASTQDKALKGEELGCNIESAEKVGELLAKRALEKGIKEVVFDRSGYRYHGRIKALAEAARKAGLEF